LPAASSLVTLQSAPPAPALANSPSPDLPTQEGPKGIRRPTGTIVSSGGTEAIGRGDTGVNTVEPELAQHAERGRDMAVGQATHELEVRARLVRRILVAQQPAQRFDLAVRPMRDVGQRALPDLAVLAISLPQQKSRW
jgi:hypothetical protein